MKVIFDLDGTLANCDARVHAHLIDHEKGYPHMVPDPDWEAFFVDCHEDIPIPHALDVLRALHKDGHDVHIWTGRSEIARSQTVQWLTMNGVPDEVIDTLIMRHADDESRDDDMKRDWLAHHGVPDLIFEDRNRVVNMWRAQGIPCYHVAPSDF